MKRARYLNGDRWGDLGPKPDLRWLDLLAGLAMLVCGIRRAFLKKERTP